jgi:hypothetical protein
MLKFARLYPITAVILLAGGITMSSQVALSAPEVDCATQWKTMQVTKTVPADMTEAVFLASCKTKEVSAMKKPAMKAKKKEMAKPAEPMAVEKSAETAAVATEAKPETMAKTEAKPKIKKAKKNMAPAPVEVAKPVEPKAVTETAAGSAKPVQPVDKAMVNAKPPVKMKKVKKVAAPVEPDKAATMTQPETPAVAPDAKAVAMKKPMKKSVDSAAKTTTMVKPEAPASKPDTKATAMKQPAKKATEPPTKVTDKPMDEEAMQQARITECGNQWKVMKVANKVPTCVTWPKFWLDCSGKMKAAGK